MTFFSGIRRLFTKSQQGAVDKKNATNKFINNSSHIKVKSMTAANSSSSASKQSSNSGYSFQYIDGRRYHANTDVAYVLPNDDDEVDRVHQQHWIIRYALQCNFRAPLNEQLEQGIKVLDSGCGPATWTFEMAETYPRSKIYGIDASSVFPEEIKPANVEFKICNIAKEIPYPDNTFDYIHQRLLVLGLTNNDWDNTLKELYRVLKPGGYIELAEPDLQDLHNMGPLMKKSHYYISDMLISRGMPTKVATQLEERLVKAGFVNPVSRMDRLNLNHTDKAGQLQWEDYKHTADNMKSVMVKVNPEWADVKEYERHVDACAIEAKKNKTCINWYDCYAQKPLLEE